MSASSDEGLGIAALEAMALNVPVVATVACGIVDFIRDGQTGLIAEADPAAISEKILQIETKSGVEAKLTKTAASLIRKTFSWPQTTVQYASLLEDVVKEDSCAIAGHALCV